MHNQATKKPTILLIAEAVTLAHFARIITLAKALPASEYNVVVACDPRYLALEETLPFEVRPLTSIPSADFTNALAKGEPVYDADTLTRYVEADLALIDALKPDLIIGDFRLSLSTSAPLSGVAYANLVNAYWSPYAQTAYPIPDIPLTKWLGVEAAQWLFNLARPLVFALHAKPINKVRKKYGLKPLVYDLRQTYTWGDFTLYADVPEMVPIPHKPSNHYFLGPVLWSTKTPLPSWWGNLPDDKPIVFVTLGSSGQTDLLPTILQALATLPLTVIAASASQTESMELPENVFLTDYLPIDKAIQRSQAIVCNGGSLTTYQALTEGVPIVGITANMDQLLNMQTIERIGAGIMVRASRATKEAIQQAVNTALASPCREAAERMKQTLSRYDTRRRFREIVVEIFALQTKPAEK